MVLNACRKNDSFLLKDEQMNLLITGINGFVGCALAESLLRLGGHVNGTVRLLGKRNSFIPAGAKIYATGEINEETAWGKALHGVEVVVHLAARVHFVEDLSEDPPTEFRLVNTIGTEHLAEQAAQAGVKRFVYLSSIKVNGEQTFEQPFTETAPYHPADQYAASKVEAEKLLKKISGKTGMEVVIIRPPLIYGPGVKANFYKMMHWLDKGFPLPLGAIQNKRSLVALDNLISLIAICVEHPAAANQTFLVSDGDDLSTTDLLQHLMATLGSSVCLLPVPQCLLKFCLGILGKGHLAQRLCGSLQVDISKAKNVLGWRPPITVKEGLKVAAEWYLGEKIVLSNGE